MSGSDTAAGAVAGASTVGAGAAAIANGNNGLLTLLGWIAVILGAVVLLSFIFVFFYKKRTRDDEE